MESDVAPDIVGFHSPGQQTVQRKGLVIAARHQAFIDIAALKPLAPDLLDRNASDNQRVEAVEGSKHALHQPAALGCVGIGIRHVVEIGRQRRLAVHGERIGRLRG